jgi:hypothetical protein
MNREGLTRLIMSLMVAGEVAAVDALAPACAHTAVLLAIRLPGGHTLPDAFDMEIRALPDPSVGRRVLGLTQALWTAVGRGWLEPQAGSGQALLALTDAAAQEFLRPLCALDSAQRSALCQAGAAWAADSTCLKNSARPLLSPRSV